MQNLISRYILLFIFFGYTLFGCALCRIYSPQTKFTVDVKTSNNKIKEVEILWVLTREFTDSLKDVYDTNLDNFIDKNEIKEVAKSLYDYVIPNNYLTVISYGQTINKEKSLPLDIKEKKVYIKNSLLHFSYKIKLDLPIKNDNALYVGVNDEQNFFVFVLQKNFSKINMKDVAIIEGNDDLIINFSNTLVKEKKDIEKKVEVQEVARKKDETYLQIFVNKVKENLLKINGGDIFALFILLGVSFIYGIVHALGPGHGKSLAFSYFTSNKSSYLRAFWISQASAFIHIIGALILVIISVFILQSILNSFVSDSIEILTKVSAFMIMALAFYILYNKLTNKSCSCSSCCSEEKHSSATWSTTKPKTVTTLKPNFMKQDLYFVLTAGLIPCPGTVILFIYAFVLKTYFAVLLAAIAISFGMGLVIFLSSFLGVSLQRFSQKSHKVANFFEILAPIIMFILGLLLFFNAEAF